MGKIKKALLTVGVATVTTGVAIIAKKVYDDYKKFVDFEVDDIDLDKAPKLYAESKIKSFKKKLDDLSNLEDIEEEEDEDDSEFWDDVDECFDDTEDFDCSSEDDLDDYEEGDDYEDDDYSVEDEESDEEKSDFEKVCGVTREEAIEFVLNCDSSYSRELLEEVEDATLAEIYSSSK